MPNRSPLRSAPCAEETPPDCALFSASPRAGGNSDAACAAFAQGFEEGLRTRREGKENEDAGGSSFSLRRLSLREFAVLPCTGCEACRAATASAAARPPFGCPLALRDQSVPLLHLLEKARSLCFVSPIYSYHLPAHFKALLDRTQPFWNAAVKTPPPSPPRVCGVILIAGRKKGDSLFTGSLLTLKYALKPLNIALAAPLALRGYDSPGDLARDAEAMRRITEYGREAALRL